MDFLKLAKGRYACRKYTDRKVEREQLMQTRLELLKTELELTSEQLAKFDPVYRKYRQEIQRVTSMNKDARMKKELITNDNALKVVSARLANQILTSTVKQRYLLIFAEVIDEALQSRREGVARGEQDNEVSPIGRGDGHKKIVFKRVFGERQLSGCRFF